VGEEGVTEGGVGAAAVAFSEDLGVPGMEEGELLVVGFFERVDGSNSGRSCNRVAERGEEIFEDGVFGASALGDALEEFTGVWRTNV